VKHVKTIQDYLQYVYYSFKHSEINKFDPKIKRICLSESSHCPEVYSQGMLGSCVVNAFCFILKYKLNTMHQCNSIQEYFKPSRYFLYHYSCLESYGLIGIVNIFTNTEHKGGGGTCPFLLLNTINKHGILNEQLWESDNIKQFAYYKMDPISIEKKNSYEYVIPKKTFLTKIAKFFNKKYIPIGLAVDKNELSDANKWKHKIIFKNINIDNNQIINFKHYLQNNNPIMICMSIDGEQMNNYSDNIFFSGSSENPIQISLTNKCEFKLNCLHCMVIVGYNDKYNAFKVLNSWGKNWGYGGYCYMSYDLFNLSLVKKNLVTSATIIDRILI